MHRPLCGGREHAACTNLNTEGPKKDKHVHEYPCLDRAFTLEAAEIGNPDGMYHPRTSAKVDGTIHEDLDEEMAA